MGKVPLVFDFKIPKIREGVEIMGSERYFFGFKYIGGNNEIKLQEDEVRAYKWVSFGELGKFLLFDNQFAETSEKLLELFPQFKYERVSRPVDQHMYD